jgi:hypothetical protein
VRSCTPEVQQHAVPQERAPGQIVPCERGERREEDAMTGWKNGTTNGCRSELADGATLRLPRGGVLEVRRGTVVVTREGDPEDHVLVAGGTHRIGPAGLSVAWALEPSEVQVTAAAERAAQPWLAGTLQRRLGMRST